MCGAPASVNEVWGVIWIAVVNEVLKHRNSVIALVQLNVWS